MVGELGRSAYCISEAEHTIHAVLVGQRGAQPDLFQVKDCEVSEGVRNVGMVRTVSLFPNGQRPLVQRLRLLNPGRHSAS